MYRSRLQFCWAARFFVVLFCLMLLAGEIVNAQDSISPTVESKEQPFRFVASESSNFWNEVRLARGLPENISNEKLFSQIKLKSKSILWLGSFRYGRTKSRSVAVSLVKDGQAHKLLVDTNRDFAFEDSEFHATSQSENDADIRFHVELKPEFENVDSEPQQTVNRVGFRWDAQQENLFAATAGAMVGTARHRNKLLLAKYEDRNANGQWTDPEDRLFVDVNGDDRLDVVMERFRGSGIRQVDGKLVAIASDPQGLKLALQDVTEQGSLIPRMSIQNVDAKIKNLNVVLATESGLQCRIRSLDQPVKVPVGAWKPISVHFDLVGNNEAYRFSFLSASSGGTRTVVAADQETEIDLLGQLTLSATTSIQKQNGGLMVTAYPSLTSDTGLFLANSKFGKTVPNTENRLEANFVSAEQDLGFGSSGFS